MLKTLCIFVALLTNSVIAAETIVTIEAYVTSKTIDTSVSDVYTADGWSYTHVWTMPNTRKAGTWGILIYDEQVLGATARLNDWHTTPWGTMYWWGINPFRGGRHLWQPVMNGGFPAGRRLDPQVDVYK